MGHRLRTFSRKVTPYLALFSILFNFHIYGASLTVATPALARVGGIDTECQANGFDFGIAKWEWDDDEYEHAEGDVSPYTTSVTGDDEEADWTASPAVDGVLVKRGGDTSVESGGTAGTVYENDHAISHITFCGNEQEDPVCGNDIQEEGEECDGEGGVSENQSCSGQCTLIDEPYCGDGEVNLEWEQCDDGNNENDDGCDAECQEEVDECEITELIENGGFEEPDVLHANLWNIYVTPLVPGWNIEWVSTVPASFGLESRPDDALLELHNSYWTPAEGDQYAELDTDWAGPDSGLDGEPASVDIYQDILTIPGEEYEVSYQFSPRPFIGAEDNILNVYVNGVLKDTVSAANVTGDTIWEERGFSFIADSLVSRVTFEDGGEHDSYGTLLDDVSVLGCEGEGPEPYCGDGIRQEGAEECDDGNNEDGDGCSAYCGIEQQFSCPFEEQEGRTIVDFGDAGLLSNQGLSEASAGPVAVDLPAGTYSVSLFSWDSYASRDTASVQPNESFKVVLENEGGVVAETNATTDLVDGVDAASNEEEVNSDLVLSEAVTSATALHAVYPDGSSTNSLRASCAAFDLVNDQGCEENCGGGEEGSTVAGYKYFDNDGDGVRDEGDDGIEDWKITLYRIGDLIETVEIDSTDPDGSDSVAALESGKIYILEANGTYIFGTNGFGNRYADVEWSSSDNQATWDENLNREGVDDALDVYVDQDDIYWGVFNLGHQYYAVYEGQDSSANLTISDWLETGQDKMDDNEGTLEVKIYEVAGMDMTLTDSDGLYSFGDVQAGHYLIIEELKGGWENTTAHYRYLEVGENESIEVLFGNWIENNAEEGNICGYKFFDLDGDGEWDEGEPGLEGWTIRAEDGDTFFDTQTNEDGRYCLNVGAGEWEVIEVVIDEGWVNTYPVASHEVNLGEGESEDNVNFGNRRTECADEADNDEDELTDSQDPACHTDGDTENEESYDPNLDDESNDPGETECNDGVDNDDDGDIDYHEDSDCNSYYDNDESGDEGEENGGGGGGGGGGAFTGLIIHTEQAGSDTVTATITWFTNKPATSRVVWDTVSHPDLELGSAPNYGYAASTPTTDTDPKVTYHTVVIEGLDSGTTYYFRPISAASPEVLGIELSITPGGTTPEGPTGSEEEPEGTGGPEVGSGAEASNAAGGTGGEVLGVEFEEELLAQADGDVEPTQDEVEEEASETEPVSDEVIEEVSATAATTASQGLPWCLILLVIVVVMVLALWYKHRNGDDKTKKKLAVVTVLSLVATIIFYLLGEPWCWLQLLVIVYLIYELTKKSDIDDSNKPTAETPVENLK